MMAEEMFSAWSGNEKCNDGLECGKELIIKDFFTTPLRGKIGESWKIKDRQFFTVFCGDYVFEGVILCEAGKFSQEMKMGLDRGLGFIICSKVPCSKEVIIDGKDYAALLYSLSGRRKNAFYTRRENKPAEDALVEGIRIFENLKP